MIKLTEITPDQSLKELLEGNIVVQLADNEFSDVMVYAQGERPNTGLPDEYVEILYNGAPRAKTSDFSILRGNLAVAIVCKTKSDGTLKSTRISQILRDVEELVSERRSGNFFYRITAGNIFTPSSVDSTTGYSTLVVNVQWTANK